MNPVPVIFGNESSNKRKTTKEARGKHYFAEDRWLLSDDMTPVPVFSTLWLRALTVIPGRGSIFFFFSLTLRLCRDPGDASFIAP